MQGLQGTSSSKLNKETNRLRDLRTLPRGRRFSTRHEASVQPNVSHLRTIVKGKIQRRSTQGYCAPSTTAAKQMWSSTIVLRSRDRNQPRTIAATVTPLRTCLVLHSHRKVSST